MSAVNLIADTMVIRVETTATALGKHAARHGGPVDPEKCPEIEGVLRGLASDDPIRAAAYRGYSTGYRAQRTARAA